MIAKPAGIMPILEKLVDYPMKIPDIPPDFNALARDIAQQSPHRLVDLVSMGITPDPKGNYYR